MSIVPVMGTVYVFKGEQLAVLKKQLDGTLKVDTCSIELDKLKKFLCSEGYAIS